MTYTLLDAAKARFSGYDAPAFNVLERTGLDVSLRAELIGLPRETWRTHANYAGQAEHWQQIHGAMLANSAHVTRALAAIAEGRVGQAQMPELSAQIRETAAHFTEHAHHHHRLEDHHIFPGFVRARPALARPLALLDADHLVLDASIQAFERALRDFPDDTAPASAFDRLAETAGRVDRIMQRHIADEEEIVIPTVLAGEP